MKKAFLFLLAVFVFSTGFSQVSTTLNGSGSDPDGTVVGYQWRQISGPATIVIDTSTIPKPTITFTVAGVYTFGLTVTDNQGAESIEDTTRVTVKPANIPPVVNAGPDQVIQLPRSISMIENKSTDLVITSILKQ